MTDRGDKVVPMGANGALLRRAFLGWQCRLRQLSMRQDEGRPSAGMMPRLTVAGQDAGRIAIVMNKQATPPFTAEFQHIVKRTHDPKERFEAALKYFQSTYYQDPMSFDDRLTAVFSLESALPQQLDGRDDCLLQFSQFNQTYELACRAGLLDQEDEVFQSTFWHNRLFNPSLPGALQILSFMPEWSLTRAEPVPIKG